VTSKIRVLGISGSLRKKSFNSALLREAVRLAPENLAIEIAEIGDLPLYNDDVREAGYPPAVEALRKKAADARAFLFSTPEYNYSVPGVLKNAIDWLSRQPNPPVMGKPTAMMGAATGPGGAMRAQYHLRQIAVFLDMPCVMKPEVFVRQAANAFDADLKLTDEATIKGVRGLLEALERLARRYE
jgi:chromate reductase, NAD(P)H dehydrogenase (quinone)